MQKFRTSVFLFICLVLLQFGPYSAFAQSIETALRSANDGNWTQLFQLRRSARDPAAQKLLSWYAYSHGAPSVNFDEMADFVAQNSDWPGLSTIRGEAEEKLTDNTSDTKFLQFVSDETPEAANAMSRYLRILKARGQEAKAKKVIQEWWPNARLTRDEQREIYGAYGSYLNTSHHAKRLNVLLHKGQYDNAMAIADVLGGGYVALAKARKGLKQNSSSVNGLIAAVPSNLQSDEGLLFDRLQWRRKANLNSGAIEILAQTPKVEQMYSPKDWWKERHIIVRRLIESKQYKQAYDIASRHRQTEGFPMAQAEWVSGWLALRFVNKPWQAFEHFEKIYKNSNSPISKARGAYWAGRASEALKHSDVAAQWYQTASKYKETFYGQLAAEKAGINDRLPPRVTPSVPMSEQGAFKTKELVKSAIWLHNAGLQNSKDLFLFQLAKNANDQSEYVQAIQLADQLGRRNIGIKIAQDLQKEKGLSFYQYLYPTLTTELRNIQDVEWAFINAIIRQESRFDQYAVSHAGARGLMQLMPATAKETARKAGVSHQLNWLTSKPDHNIYLGSRYLKHVTERFGGHYAMAAASYNAGPGRVDRWVKEFGDPRRGEIDFLDWAELIPIYETRNYVQRVLEGVYVYRDQLRGKQPWQAGTIHTKTKQ